MNSSVSLEAGARIERPTCPSTPGQTAPPLGWFDRQLRQRLLARLDGLADTQIRIVDADGCHAAGHCNDQSALATIEVHDPVFYRRVATSGSLGAAESFMSGEWSCSDLVTLLRLFARNVESLGKADRGSARIGKWFARVASIFRRNTRAGSRKNISAHYDLGNEFFELFLDPTMMYSSACFDCPDATLEEASLAKLDRICRRLQIEPSDHVVEIGTGWGGFAEYAALHHGCRVTTTTISAKQFEYAKRRLNVCGEADSVSLLRQDYRDLDGQFDKLVSIEMVEAVGYEFLDAYFQQCDRLLKPGGRMVIQAIVMPEQRFDQYRRSVDFVQKHIFPGGFLPSLASIQASVGRVTNLRLVGAEDFAPSYARTLHEWRTRLLNRLEEVRELGFSEEFVRTWDYYFAYCEAAFHERAVGLVQLEWVKVGDR